jgi:hypothetical protein
MPAGLSRQVNMLVVIFGEDILEFAVEILNVSMAYASLGGHKRALEHAQFAEDRMQTVQWLTGLRGPWARVLHHQFL